MPLYFLVHDSNRFQEELQPVLATCWRLRCFEPCRPLCTALLPRIREFQQRFFTGPDEPLLARLVTERIPFARGVWRLLVSEVLLYAAVEIPEVPTAPETFTCLLAPTSLGEENRERFSFIQLAHFGTHDLVFGGGFYRPEHAGYNGVDDVARLADYLAGVDTALWTEADLRLLAELNSAEDRSEEVELAREWFPLLVDLYRQSRERRRIIVCEAM